MRNPFRSANAPGAAPTGRQEWPALLIAAMLLAGLVLSGCSQAPQAAASEGGSTPVATQAAEPATPSATTAISEGEPVAKGEPWKLVVLHTNDVMGQVLPCG